MIIAPNPPPDESISLSPHAPRILFADWADGKSKASPIVTPPAPPPDLSAPDPCIICGAPQNACTTHDPEAIRAMRQTRIQGTDAANADGDSNLYVCPDDVVQEYRDAGSSRPSWRLIHAKGDVITREQAVALGLITAPPAIHTGTAVPTSPAQRPTVEGHPVTVPQQ